MAKTKKKHSGKPLGMYDAEMLARKRMIREAVQEAADDATVQLRADMATQKALWLAVCSVADAYGFGPERMKKEVDTDYAYEKLRLKAERVTGMKIEYLYEHEAQEEQV